MDLDLDFIRRVRRTSLMVVVLGVALFWQPYGAWRVLAWMVGALLGLSILASVEWSVRRFISPDAQGARGLQVVTLLKLPLILLVLGLSVWAAETMHDRLLLVWLVAGFSVPSAIIILKLIGQKVVQATGATPKPRPRSKD